MEPSTVRMAALQEARDHMEPAKPAVRHADRQPWLAGVLSRLQPSNPDPWQPLDDERSKGTASHQSTVMRVPSDCSICSSVLAGSPTATASSVGIMREQSLA